MRPTYLGYQALQMPLPSSPFPSSSPHSVAGLLVQPSQTQPETAVADLKKKKKQREEKRKRTEIKWKEDENAYLNLSPPFSLQLTRPSPVAGRNRF